MVVIRLRSSNLALVPTEVAGAYVATVTAAASQPSYATVPPVPYSPTWPVPTPTTVPSPHGELAYITLVSQRQMYVCETLANVRSEPGTSYAVTETLTNEYYVTVYGKTEDTPP